MCSHFSVRPWLAPIIAILLFSLVPDVSAANDTTSPTLHSVSVSPGTVNAGESVTVTMHVTDAGSGTRNIAVFYRLANGSFAPVSPQMTLVSGTPQDGTWRGTFQVPEAAASGTWTLQEVQLRDLAGNSGFVLHPTAPLPSGSFTVIGGNDTMPPTLHSATASPGTVNAGESVTMTMHVTDAGSGTRNIAVFYRLANGSFAPSSPQMSLALGTPQDGIWRGTLQVPETAASGTWTLQEVQLRDLAGNSGFVLHPTAPLPSGSFTVVGGDDTTSPTLNSLTVSPETINAGDTMTLTMHVTDAGSGTRNIAVFYRLANGNFAPTSPQMSLASGTPKDGIWRGSFQVPSAAAAGTWTLHEVQLRDLAGNSGFVLHPTAPLPNGTFTVKLRCEPRLPVAVTMTKLGDGRLRAVIRAGQSPLSRLEIGGNGQPLPNAEVEVQGVATGLTSSRVIELPSSPAEVTVYVKQQDPNLAATVPLVVHDACGPWRTFIGGGASAFR